MNHINFSKQTLENQYDFLKSSISKVKDFILPIPTNVRILIRHCHHMCIHRVHPNKFNSEQLK